MMCRCSPESPQGSVLRGARLPLGQPTGAKVLNKPPPAGINGSGAVARIRTQSQGSGFVLSGWFASEGQLKEIKANGPRGSCGQIHLDAVQRAACCKLVRIRSVAFEAVSCHTGLHEEKTVLQRILVSSRRGKRLYVGVSVGFCFTRLVCGELCLEKIVLQDFLEDTD